MSMFSFISYASNQYDLSSYPQFLVIPPPILSENGCNSALAASNRPQGQNQQALDATNVLTQQVATAQETRSSRQCAKSRSIYYKKQHQASDSLLELMRRRKRQKQTKQKKEALELAANLVPGYLGDQSIEIVLKYINSPTDCNSQEKYNLGAVENTPTTINHTVDNHHNAVQNFATLKKNTKNAQTKKFVAKSDDSGVKAVKMPEQLDKDELLDRDNGVTKNVNNDISSSTNAVTHKDLLPTHNLCRTRHKSIVDDEMCSTTNNHQEEAFIETEIGFQPVIRKKPSIRRKLKPQSTNKHYHKYQHSPQQHVGQKVLQTDKKAANNIDANPYQSDHKNQLTVMQYLHQLKYLKSQHPEDYPAEQNENARNAFLYLQNRLRSDFAALERQIQRCRIV